MVRLGVITEPVSTIVFPQEEVAGRKLTWVNVFFRPYMVPFTGKWYYTTCNDIVKDADIIPISEDLSTLTIMVRTPSLHRWSIVGCKNASYITTSCSSKSWLAGSQLWSFFCRVPLGPLHNKNFLATIAYFRIDTSYIALLKARGPLGPHLNVDRDYWFY